MVIDTPFALKHDQRLQTFPVGGGT